MDNGQRSIFSQENGQRGEQLPLLSTLEISDSCLRASASAETIPTSHPLKRDTPQQPSEVTQDVATNTTPHALGTIRQTALNISKACMGTGTLALPYAASQGGLLFNIFGLFMLSVWNLYSIDRLVKCRDLIPQENSNGTHTTDSRSSRCARHRRTSSSMRKLFRGTNTKRVEITEDELLEVEVLDPPDLTATYGRVAWYSLGPLGLLALDCIMVMLLCGIVIAYEAAVIGFVRETPFTTGSAALDSLWTVLIIVPLSFVPDMSYLSKFSAMGIVAIFFTFAVIFGYGIMENGIIAGFLEVSWDDLWPKSFTGASNWFGIVAFGFGVTPIAYNIQESMREPQNMPRATEIALLLVCGTYVVISDGVAILFKPSVASFEGDVLQELPESWIPTLVRLAMTFVVVVTVPLLVVPCAELIEGKIGLRSNSKAMWSLLVRFGICLFCTGAAFVVPAFVHVVSFIGAFCLSLTSFVFPPLFHLLLLRKREKERTAGAQLIDSEDELARFDTVRRNEGEESGLRKIAHADTALLILGVVATIVASILTFANMVEEIRLVKQ